MNLTLFDLDGTLLPRDSDHAFGEFLVTLGWADAQDFQRRNDAFYEDYVCGRLDIHAYVDFATQPWRHRPAAQQQQVLQQFMKTIIEPLLVPHAFDLVDRHRQEGDWLALVTATNDFVTRPIARRLGVPTLIATELDQDGAGAVTGRIRGVPAFREGKIERVNAWLAAQGRQLADFERCTFYSDSTNDLPLMEQVSHPVATHPSPALEAVALARGWPILRFFP